MNEWTRKLLGDLIRVKHGFAFKGQHFASEGEKLVLKPGNFPIGGGIRLRPGKDDFYTGTYPSEFELSPGDLVLVMTDLTQAAPILGSPAFVPERPGMLHNQRLGLVTIKPEAEVDKRFLYYLLLSHASRSQLRATATGATVRHTAPERIYNVSVAIPEPKVQEVIGAVLGLFDDLIENNQRRVAVLKEMARAVYEEWFVHLRFPGYDSVAPVDSALGPLPAGWTTTTVGDVLELKYGKALKSDVRGGGSVAVVGSSGVVGWHDSELIPGPAIVVGRKGNVGSVTWLDGPSWPIDTTYYVQTELPLRFVAEQLRRTEFLNTHAAVPGLSREQAYSKAFVRPTDELLGKYEAAVAPLASEARALSSGADQLASMRDLLLPKLVTGRIDVSGLDLDALVAGAVA